MTGSRPSFNVVEIMSSIREDNRRKRERGIFTDEELDEMARERLRAFAQTAHIDPRLLDRFLDPATTGTSPPTTSSAPTAAAPARASAWWASGWCGRWSGCTRTTS
jgi:hypothetical protein